MVNVLNIRLQLDEISYCRQIRETFAVQGLLAHANLKMTTRYVQRYWLHMRKDSQKQSLNQISPFKNS
jgi:integrase